MKKKEPEVAKNSVSLFAFLTMTLLPCVLIPGLAAVIYDFSISDLNDSKKIIARNQIFLDSLTADLDREVEAQEELLSTIGEKIALLDLKNKPNYETLASIFERQRQFESIHLLTPEGHILWSQSKENRKQNIQIEPLYVEKKLEIRVDDENNTLELFNFKPAEPAQGGLMLVGVSSLKSLNEKCAAIIQKFPEINIVFFPNHGKIKSFDCGSDNKEFASNDSRVHEYRKMISDIKNYLNDNRYQVAIPDYFTASPSHQVPIKLGVVPSISAGELNSVRDVFVYLFSLVLTMILLLLAIKFSGAKILDPLLVLEENLNNKVPIEILKIKSSIILELRQLLNSIIDSNELHEEQRIRTRVMQKAFMDLFTSDTVDLLLAKSVELIATQTDAVHVLFVPEKYGELRQFENSEVFIGIHAWSWHQLKLNKLKKDEVDLLLKEIQETRTYDFRIKSTDGIFGIVKVYFDKTPSDFDLSIMHGLISLVETTLSKHERVKKETMITAELELAKMVQETVLDQQSLKHGDLDIAYHFQPSTRLGGDWFYVFESGGGRFLNFFMGDVSGSGLTQGLVASAVKGSMDMLVALAKADEMLELSPSFIAKLLDRVIKRILAKNELTMSFLAAQVDYQAKKLKVYNAGHTFPMMVRKPQKLTKDLAENQVIYLSKNQSPLIGIRALEGDQKDFENTSYDLEEDDIVFIYTDGLSGSKKIKSTVFTKILQRKLRQLDLNEDPHVVRDEILSLFQYYTQSEKIEDDVCFLVVKFLDKSAKVPHRIAV